MSGARPGERGDPHGWNRFDNYLKTHQGYLAYVERQLQHACTCIVHVAMACTVAH